MEIIYQKTDELIPYRHNPRFNDEAIEPVANSIKEFGFKVPVIVDKYNVIIAGHTRVKAAKVLGIEEIPCIIAGDLTDEQARELRLVDNKTTELSSWDYEQLDRELEQIYEISGIDMEQFGFTNIDYADIEDRIDELNDIAESGGTERKERTIVCPYCGEEFTI